MCANCCMGCVYFSKILYSYSSSGILQPDHVNYGCLAQPELKSKIGEKLEGKGTLTQMLTSYF